MLSAEAKQRRITLTEVWIILDIFCKSALEQNERNYYLVILWFPKFPITIVHSQKRANCSKSLITKPISGCVPIACSTLMITSLLQVVNIDLPQVANCMQAWCKLFHQLVASLQISSCSKSDVHRLDATWWSQQAWYNLLANSIRPLKSTTCIKSGVFGCVIKKGRQLANFLFETNHFEKKTTLEVFLVILVVLLSETD